MSDESKSISVPKWDGKTDSCLRYLAKIAALAEYYNCEDTLDETEMAMCLTVREFKILSAQSTLSTAEEKKVGLFKQNKCLCAIITFG